MPVIQLISVAAVFVAIILFGHFCIHCYRDRLRKNVDAPVRMSLLSVAMLLLPIVVLLALIFLLIRNTENASVALAYGFCIFFGWITAIILGMTFKTLPFILWNKTYHTKAGKGRTPNPKDLFNADIFRWMSIAYLAGFILFLAGVLIKIILLLKLGAALLLIAAILYNTNVLKMVFHKPIKTD